MKALRMYKAGDLRVEDVPIPEIKEGEVLLKVSACGVCGSDIPRVNKFGAHIAPLTIGHEFSARIEQLGKNVSGWKVGDRVTVPPLIPCYQCRWCNEGNYSLCDNYDYFGSRRDGAMAEYVVSPAKNLLHLPDNVNDEDAATTDPCANAMHALTIGKFSPGETVCVYGVGPIGLYAIQCAKALGAKQTIAVDLNEQKLEVAKKCGADYIVNTSACNAPEVIREITGDGAELVLDMTGAPPAQLAAIESARKTGRVVFLGISHRGLNLTESLVDKIQRYQIAIYGSWNSFTDPFPGSDWTIPLRLFSEGKISSKHMISHRLPLEEGPSLFRQIDAGGLFFNKILFIPSL